MANSVIRKSYVNIRDEKVAAGTITPGMLVERTSDDKVQAHSIAGGPANPLFAIEDAPQGKTKTDNYFVDDKVLLWKPVPGERVEAIADDDTNTSIAIGDFLESDGGGRLRKLSPVQSSAGIAEFAANVVAVALETATTGARFTVEIV